jgi:hypothetical protein
MHAAANQRLKQRPPVRGCHALRGPRRSREKARAFIIRVHETVHTHKGQNRRECEVRTPTIRAQCEPAYATELQRRQTRCRTAQAVAPPRGRLGRLHLLDELGDVLRALAVHGLSALGL